MRKLGAVALDRLRAAPLVTAAAALLLVTALLALSAPWLPLADPNATRLDARLLSPLTPGHLLGTDQLGRDVLSRLAFGARLSLAVAAGGTAVAAAAGTLIGMLSGYAGRSIDMLLMRGIDVVMAFPYLLLALALVAVLGPSLKSATLAISIVNVPFFARTVRASVQSLRRSPFIEAARVGGLSTTRILVSELLPNVAPVVVVAAATSLGWMIVETAGLSFLGLGAQPPQADLGGMLGQARHLLTTAPHLTLAPGGVIFVIVLCLNVLADGLRDALDPKHAGAAQRAETPRAAAAANAAKATESAPASRAGDAPAGTSSSTPPTFFSVSDLRVTLATPVGREPLLDAISFELAPGGALGLVGESGSGKTLLTLALLGLLEAPLQVEKGELCVDGRRVHRDAFRKLRGTVLGYVPQDPLNSLHPLYRVERQLSEPLRFHQRLDDGAVRRRVRSALDQAKLGDPERVLGAYPHELSGGMRQRVAIAAALLLEPRVLLLDEPTTSLDATTQAGIVATLNELRRESGVALVFVSHDLALVSELCDSVVVLRQGRIVEAGPLKNVIREPRHAYTRRLLDSVPRLERRRWGDAAPEPS
ncbi:MAG TPA: dipeptide/oligopeptide/nickel ABC transporter permease/ATP-binding protein [Polyangiaceae bacterium]